VDNIPAATIKDTAKIEKCTTNIDIRYVNMPMFVGPYGLLKKGVAKI
jgi:hypothetical protein